MGHPAPGQVVGAAGGAQARGHGVIGRVQVEHRWRDHGRQEKHVFLGREYAEARKRDLGRGTAGGQELDQAAGSQLVNLVLVVIDREADVGHRLAVRAEAACADLLERPPERAHPPR
jgi:hypothetical protein